MAAKKRKASKKKSAKRAKKPLTKAEIEFKKRLGRRLAVLRTRAGLTQEKLAAKVGVTFETISRHERGDTMLGLIRLRQIAIALDVDMADFFPKPQPTPAHDEAVGEILDALDRRPLEDVRLIGKIARDVLGRVDEVAPKRRPKSKLPAQPVPRSKGRRTTKK